MILLITISCGDNGGNVDTKLQKGTDGLVMKFMKNIPKQVYEKDKLYLNFEISNQGYTDIKEGILLPLIERDFIQIDSWELSSDLSADSENTVKFDLDGKSLSSTRGEKKVITLMLNAKEIEDTRNKQKTNIVISACYPYSSVLSDTICIDTDPNDLTVAKKTCKVKDVTSAGQGGPVVINKIEEKILPGDSKDSVRVQFIIHAINKGDGILIDYDKYRDICIGRNPEKEDYNSIKIKGLRFSDYAYEDGDFECEPNPLKEVKGEYIARCVLKAENSIPKSMLTFQTPIVLELIYGYKTAISEEVEILNRNEQLN